MFPKFNMAATKQKAISVELSRVLCPRQTHEISFEIRSSVITFE